ncbi:hypothetical protein CL617_00110 [archaeon]|nr:hypothetical protein [archaeon]|tara:strand:- start:3039 stop:3362 length:324 start_codon:yes stop_codon:yes gene_type:complete
MIDFKFLSDFGLFDVILPSLFLFVAIAIFLITIIIKKIKKSTLKTLLIILSLIVSYYSPLVIFSIFGYLSALSPIFQKTQSFLVYILIIIFFYLSIKIIKSEKTNKS